jgi:hypothetical protein
VDYVNKLANKNNKKQLINKLKKQLGNPVRRAARAVIGKDATQLVEKFAAVTLAKSVAQRKKIKKKTRGISRSQLSLSPCVIKYALACSDPFQIAARGCCVPVGSSPSMKAHAFVRLDLTIGTSGSAIILLTPSLANDMPSIYYTNSTFSGTQLTPLTSSASFGPSGTSATIHPQWNTQAHNGPFTTLQVVGDFPTTGVSTAAFVEGKMVAAGARSQYTGTTLNESGLVYTYHDPAHEATSGLTMSTIGAYGDTLVTGVSRKTNFLVVHAVTPDEMVYSNSGPSNSAAPSGQSTLLFPYSNGNYQWPNSVASYGSYFGGVTSNSTGTYVFPVGVPIGAMVITGKAGETHHVEFVFHMEFAGPGAATMLTPTSPDPVGSDMVRTAALTLPQSQMANPKTGRWDLMYSALHAVVKAAAPRVVPAAIGAITAMLG